MILYISDITANASTGYGVIGKGVCSYLSERMGYHVVALSISYRGQEHHFPFTLVPTTFGEVASLVNGLCKGKGVSVEAVVIALDIPVCIELMNRLKVDGVPLIGLFPVEGAPLRMAWTMELFRLNAIVTLSDFGKQVLEEAGLEASVMHVPADVDRDVSEDEIAAMRERFSVRADEFLVLTVAANQERKNLWAGYDIISRLAKRGVPVKYVVVTQVESPYGWDLSDLAAQYGLHRVAIPVEKRLSRRELSALYAAADVFLLPSKAEGLGMPIREAQLMGCPVVAGNHTAIREQLADGRGFPVSHEYEYIDPFGNSWRYFIDREKAADVLERIYRNRDAVRNVVVRAKQYAEGFTWEKSASVVADAIRKCALPEGRREGHTAPTL